MTNFDYIKTLSLDEFCDLRLNGCHTCIYKDEDCQKNEETSCGEGFKKWLGLEREVEINE